MFGQLLSYIIQTIVEICIELNDYWSLKTIFQQILYNFVIYLSVSFLTAIVVYLHSGKEYIVPTKKNCFMVSGLRTIMFMDILLKSLQATFSIFLLLGAYQVSNSRRCSTIFIISVNVFLLCCQVYLFNKIGNPIIC